MVNKGLKKNEQTCKQFPLFKYCCKMVDVDLNSEQRSHHFELVFNSR